MYNNDIFKIILSFFGFIFLVIPSVLAVVKLTNEVAYITFDELEEFNFEYIGNAPETKLTAEKDFVWYSDSFENISNTKNKKISKITIHTSDSAFKVKGKASIFKLRKEMKEKYPEYKFATIHKKKGDSNYYFESDNSWKVLALAGNDFFVFDIEFKNNSVLHNKEKLEIVDIVQKVQKNS
jgi:hypothetical protein